MDELIRRGALIATEEVLHELERKDDEVYEWARQRDMFVDTNEAIQLAATGILRNHPKLIDQRKNRSGADPFVIALAQVEGCAVVTAEKPTTSSKRPNIPDVCDALGIQWLTILQLFRAQGWSF